MQKRLLFLLALLMTFMSSAMAQVTTSSLSGTVVADGEEVIGATVDVVHKPSGTHYRAVTNDKGVYTINGMRVGGPYEVTVRCIGFAEQKTGGINLQLGETFNLKTTLSETAKEMQEVMVSAKGSKFSYERTGASTNISNEQMIAMPTVSRNVTDFTRLSPYGGNGMTFQGSDGRTANFTVDGANFNNNFGLSSTLPGGGNPISMEAIEELQVVISPFDVRQTGFIGGALNAITKSGTNTFKGQAYVYHQNENMRGDAVDREFISGSRDRDRTTTYGFSLAGPIIKNKLFFFVNGELIKSPGTGTSWRATENGVGNADAYQSYTTIADMERVQEHVARKYGYNTGSFTSFPADADNKKLLAGILVHLQKQAFAYLEKLESGEYTHEDLEEIIRFVQRDLCCRKADIKELEDADLVIYLKKKLNRPMRVCGVVKNVGEPGGGPFLCYNADGTVSLQILESSQIDTTNEEYVAMFKNGTHFNPVDLVCGTRNYKGEQFDLPAFVDKSTGFISSKSKNGRELKALELPGLWNGAMSDWSTVFVEVPIETFNPVKTVNDLLRPQHQPAE